MYLLLVGIFQGGFLQIILNWVVVKGSRVEALMVVYFGYEGALLGFYLFCRV